MSPLVPHLKIEGDGPFLQGALRSLWNNLAAIGKGKMEASEQSSVDTLSAISIN